METTNETQGEQTVENVQSAQEQTNTEQNVDPKTIMRGANVFELICAVSNFISLFTVILAMFFGVATLFSTTVNPVSAINNILALFFIRAGNVYETLASVAATVAYIVLFILIIKSALRQIKYFLKVLKKTNAATKWENLTYMYVVARDAAYKAIFFIALCKILSGGTLTVGSYFVITVFLINYALNSTLVFIQRNKSNLRSKEVITEFIFSVIRIGIIIACACLSATYLILPSGLDLAFGVSSLFNSTGISARIVHVLYDLIIKHVLDIVIAFYYLVVLNTLFYDVGYSTSTRITMNEDVKSLSKKLMIIAGVSAVISCILLVVSGFHTQFDVSILENCFYALKVQYLPAILLIAVLFTLATMPFDNNAKSTSKT